MSSVHYFDCEGPDARAIALALKLAADLALKGTKEITIFLPTLQQAKSTVLTDVIGLEAAKKLSKGQPYKLGGATVRMVSDRTYNEYVSNGVVVALWPSTNMRKKLEPPSYEALVIVPWLKEENYDWAKEREAKVLSAV
ncbi:hypothetical protein D3C85_628360 [compost metagenome]